MPYSRAYTSFLLELRLRALHKVSWCQCPLGLIPHFYMAYEFNPYYFERTGVNALSGLYLISTVPLQKPRFYAVSRTCFCRYLSEYSDNSRFSCMLTFWTFCRGQALDVNISMLLQILGIRLRITKNHS